MGVVVYIFRLNSIELGAILTVLCTVNGPSCGHIKPLEVYAIDIP